MTASLATLGSLPLPALVMLAGGVALLLLRGVARYVLVAEPHGAPAQHTRVTDVLRHTRGRWLIAHHHAELLSEGA